MKIPLQISFRQMEPSAAIETSINEKAAELSKFSERITSCHVVVAQAAKSHRKGNHYEVRVIVTIPGKEIVASRQPKQHNEYEDVYVVLRDAFDSACRQLEEYVRCQRSDVKYGERLV